MIDNEKYRKSALYKKGTLDFKIAAKSFITKLLVRKEKKVHEGKSSCDWLNETIQDSK